MKVLRTLGYPVLALTLLVASAVRVLAAPARVIVIRHAEKDEPETDNHLNERGYRRAQALVGFFLNNPAVVRFGAPVAIYATEPKDEDGSLRPIETVTPLAQDLGIRINSGFKKKEVAGMVREILAKPEYEGRTVVICWQHTGIPEIARAFGLDSAPEKWPKRTYDRAWILDFSGDHVVSFNNMAQNLLPGDSDSKNDGIAAKPEFSADSL